MTRTHLDNHGIDLALDLSDALPLLKRPRTILAGSIARVGGL